MNSQPKPSQQTGFTLIEIIVALTVIAIALAAVIKASSNHTFSANYLKTKTLAHYVAMNHITGLQVEKKWPGLGTKKYDVEMANTEWFINQEIVKTADDNTRQVRVTVYADDDLEKNLTKLIAYLAKPPTSNPGTQEP